MDWEAALAEFSNRYSNDQACMNALIAKKWPEGFVCPRCGHREGYRIASRRIPLFECKECAHQTSPLVGTIFEKTHVPLTKWFKAMYLFMLPDGISAVRLSRIIQVTYKTAWLMLHKIRHAVWEFDAKELLRGEVKVSHDRYGQSPFRYAVVHPHVTAVVVGCTVDGAGEPEHVKIRLLPHTRGKGEEGTTMDMMEFIDSNVDRKASNVQKFQRFRPYRPLWNYVRRVRVSLRDTYVSLGLKHLQAYLNEYTCRYRLRLDEEESAMQQKLLQMCTEIPTITYGRLIARNPYQPVRVAAA